MTGSPRFLVLLATLTLLGLPALVEAAPTPYPQPAQTVEDAIKLVSKHFYREHGVDKHPRAQWQITRAEYTNYYNDERLSEWSWIVVFHISNDFSQSEIYLLTRDGKIKKLGGTI